MDARLPQLISPSLIMTVTSTMNEVYTWKSHSIDDIWKSR